jgi:hypothetical protein
MYTNGILQPATTTVYAVAQLISYPSGPVLNIYSVCSTQVIANVSVGYAPGGYSVIAGTISVRVSGSAAQWVFTPNNSGSKGQVLPAGLLGPNGNGSMIAALSQTSGVAMLGNNYPCINSMLTYLCPGGGNLWIPPYSYSAQAGTLSS